MSNSTNTSRGSTFAIILSIAAFIVSILALTMALLNNKARLQENEEVVVAVSEVQDLREDNFRALIRYQESAKAMDESPERDLLHAKISAAVEGDIDVTDAEIADIKESFDIIDKEHVDDRNIQRVVGEPTEIVKGYE